MMTKQTKYQTIHRLLFLREDVVKEKIDVEDFYKNAMKVANRFLGDGYTELDKRVSDELIGIVNMGGNLSFKYTRSILLDLMNDIDRSEE